MKLRVRPAVSENGKRYTKQVNRFSRLCAGKLFYNHEIVVSGAQKRTIEYHRMDPRMCQKQIHYLM